LYLYLVLVHFVSIDQRLIQRLESGNVTPSYFYLLEIAVGLEISLVDLVPKLK
jgi:putative transcriptional regulator